MKKVDKETRRSRSSTTSSTATSATVPTPRSRVSHRCHPFTAKATSSPPATPALSDGAAAVVLCRTKRRASAADAARRVQGLGRRRLRARRDGHRAGLRGAEAARAAHLKVDDIDLWELTRRSRHSACTPVTRSASTPRSTTSTAAPSPSAILRHDRSPLRRTRPARTHSPQGQVGRRDDVHRRRTRRGRPLRDLLVAEASAAGELRDALGHFVHSSRCIVWPMPSTRQRVTLGICAAVASPCTNGKNGSSAPCITSVGHTIDRCASQMFGVA